MAAVARQRAACGTLAAYRRHLRDGEPVDAACAQAKTDAGRAERARAEDAKKVEPEPPVLAEPVSAGDVLAAADFFLGDGDEDGPSPERTLADLESLRLKLKDAIEFAPPSALGPLSGQLRQVVMAIHSLTSGTASDAGAKGAPATAEAEGVAEDEFTRARRERAARQAGA